MQFPSYIYLQNSPRQTTDTCTFCLNGVEIIPLVFTCLKGIMRYGGIIFHQQDIQQEKKPNHTSGHALVQGQHRNFHKTVVWSSPFWAATWGTQHKTVGIAFFKLLILSIEKQGNYENYFLLLILEQTSQLCKLPFFFCHSGHHWHGNNQAVSKHRGGICPFLITF